MTKPKTEVRKEDVFEPNYRNICDTCEQRPTVFVKGSQPYDSNLCGPCFFGTSRALEPDNWNGDI